VKIAYPTHCPSCKTELVKPEGEAAWRCENYACEAQVLRRLIHHVSKDAMNIDGFGEKYVVRFNELDWLDGVADIYRLDYDKIAELEGFGQRSADNLREAIDMAKNNGIARLLYILDELESLGVNMKRLDSEVKQEAITDGVFSGKTILFTGKLLMMSRTDAKAKAVAAGAKPISAVSGNLNILVVGEKPGSKLKKANELGTVEVMTEEEFLSKL